MSARETPKERLAYHAYATAERLAMRLPERWSQALFRGVADAAFAVAPGVRRVVEANIGRVMGRDPGSPLVRATTREAFRSYARYWYDTFRLRGMPDEEVLRRMRCEGIERLERAADDGRGAILALPHLGNWDAAGKWVHLRGWRITAVAEVLRPERLFELFLRHRRELGMNIVPLWDARKVGEELVALVAQNHFIALVSDRDLKGRGVEVEMFGAKRRLPVGPALLSLATGSPLHACAVYDTDDGWTIFIGERLEVERTGQLRRDVTALTQKLAAAFERSIEAAPTQWHMFQPAWEEEPEAVVADVERSAAPA
ncbi:MAG TPA: phosphatidylinositol mannoside acyltransferase [Actinomycetota bacterium]|nr:phosphatidylinositol mannoside acyltransferase [Actinomycetota bacterium]